MHRSQLEYILAVEQLKNFGKAAEACFVTQSTLSAMVAKFEYQTGIILFNRKTRPISVTAQGREVLKSLKSINREFQILDERINEIKEYEEGKLSIACIPTVASSLYPLILNKISQEHAKVEFTIHELTTKEIEVEIINGTIDVGIVSIPLKNKELIEYPLYFEDFLLYDCADKMKLSSYRVSDIDLDRLWLMEEGHCMRNQVGKICELRQQKKINGNLIYNCGTIHTLIKMVQMNEGVTLLPRLATVNNSHLDNKCIHPLSEPVPTRQIGLITHKNFIKRRMLQFLMSAINGAISTYIPDRLSQDFVVQPFD